MARTVHRQSTPDIRHQFRTPLNHIIGYTDMLLEDAEIRTESGRSRGDSLRGIRTEADALLQLVQAERIESRGRLDVSPEVMQPHIQAILVQTGKLLSDPGSNDIGDVLRIANAAHDLLTMTEGLAASQAKASYASRDAEEPVHVEEASVLIVDDDELNRDLLSRHLEKLGYKATGSSGAGEALTLVEQRRFDIALVDCVMPGVDGFELLERFKKDVRLRDLPVIMISALDEMSAVTKCLERGAEDYLLKPFDAVLLGARLRAVLERARLRARERERAAELERIGTELRQSNEDLKRFAYAASHDLQAPLRTITAHLQLLERRIAGKLSPDELVSLKFPIDAARRMHQLVRDLLTYSQISTTERRLSTVDCEEVLATTLADLSSEIKETGAVITHDHLPTVIADGVQLGQLLLNLIGNAIKYRRDSVTPQIHVGVQRDFADWHFSVRDNGEGIPAEYRGEIFKLFRRLHGEERPGTGLGLAICQRIVDHLGGRIWVDSEPGTGSTFYFTIPAI
jgi:light-regulated signal transduction histidine kinase (bacteriophytochrome)